MKNFNLDNWKSSESSDNSIDFLCKSKNHTADRMKKHLEGENSHFWESPDEDKHDEKALERKMVFWNIGQDDRLFEDRYETDQ